MAISKQSYSNKFRIVIPLGDPAGIGAEVTLKALNSQELPSRMQPLLVGCKRSLEIIYSNLKSQGINSLSNPKFLKIEDLPISNTPIPGQPNAVSGDASFHWLTHAANLVMKNQARALVTAPISKQFWHQAGHVYPGQTERLAELTGTQEPSMLFTAVSKKNGWRLNTLLATTHIPLAKVPNQLTPELIESKLNTLFTFCKRFKTNPRIVVAGLNPHAGEDGKIGTEEIQWMIPLLKNWQVNHPEVKLNGPIPPDSCWLSASRAWEELPNEQSPDGILALYHDQGLIPMKLIAFDEAVNTTLGLPFIRTSPDHGTAFDIAGKGLARPDSMIAALKASWDLTSNQ